MSSLDERVPCNKYYSFRIFPRFRLVKTTRIIHHKQLLLKSGKNFVILNQWRQKYSPLWIIEPLTEKTLAEVVLILVSRRTKSSFSTLRVWKYFEYEKFCRTRRVESTLAFGVGG